MNELLFLGTGAADWDISERNGFFRRNSAALLNGELMLDCGDHVFDFAEKEGLPDLFDGVTDILITHCHDDHFSPDSVRRIANRQKIRLGCCGWVKEAVGEHENIEFRLLSPLCETELGNFRVMPLLANHDVVLSGNRAAFHYVVTTPEGKKLFYGLDGAWFLRPSWNEMQNHKFDVMVFDCTVGDSDDWRLFEHNTIPMLRKMIPEILSCGILAEGGKLVASHLAKGLHQSHEHTAEILDKLGMMTAFDGMKLPF